MDPLTIGVLRASIIVGLAGTSLAGLKAWNGWLELKKMELTQIAGERGLPPATGRIEIADLGSESASSRRSPPESTFNSPSALRSPDALSQRRSGSPSRTASFFCP